jgi:hypothetical protein
MHAFRYVILRHDGIAEPHFDLMFEKSPGSMLMCWRASHWPIDQSTSITRLPDHRREYLDYEGPISGDRGTVTRIARGTCSISDSIHIELDDGTKFTLN